MSDRRAIGCRSEAFLLENLAAIQVIGWDGGTTLKAGIEGSEQRRQLIATVRGGQHVELALTAKTFRQKDGVPNKRFLRFKPDALEAFATSFIGMPVLVDHDQWTQKSRIGTITSSALGEHGGTGWSSFTQGLHIVKPEAVISVLDGTLDRFSIGWAATGPVFCTVHKQDRRGLNSCGCWPGDKVTIDGVTSVVEFEYQAAEGTEVSAVNVPAVKGTRIEDVRAALAAELGLSLPPPLPEEPPKEIAMLTRLAAVLGLSALTAAEEDRAVQAIESDRRALASERTQRLAAEQERDIARSRITQLEADVTAAKTLGVKAAVDAAIDGAYRDGKLRFGRDSEGTATPSRFEPMLRKLATSEGIDALKAELAGMPQVVPIGQRPLDDAKEPPKDGANGLGSELKSIAAQLGLDEKDVDATARDYYGQEG